MTQTQFWILVAAVAGFGVIAVVGFWQAVRVPWPSGPRMTRTSALDCEVTVIDAPGNDGARLLLLDACTTSTVALFTAWHAWRPKDSVDAVQVFPAIGVHFIDDSTMDDIQAALFNGEKVAAYLSDASSKFKRVPLVVIRKSCATEMINSGQPLVHELLFALMTFFLPDDVGVHDRSHIAWDLVQGAALRTYRDLYAPKT